MKTEFLMKTITKNPYRTNRKFIINKMLSDKNETLINKEIKNMKLAALKCSWPLSMIH